MRVCGCLSCPSDSVLSFLFRCSSFVMLALHWWTFLLVGADCVASSADLLIVTDWSGLLGLQFSSICFILISTRTCIVIIACGF